MKFYILYITIFLAFLITINSHNLKNSTEYKTFLVKTQLNKQELESLLQQGETQLVNLKKNKTYAKKNKTKVQKVLNPTIATEDPLQKKIEQEIKEDALHPLHEFHVNRTEVKTLVTKPNARFIDSLYEKRFGNFYGYLTLFMFIFVMIYNKDYIFNQKNFGKNNYLNRFDYDDEREYILVKNN